MRRRLIERSALAARTAAMVVDEIGGNAKQVVTTVIVAGEGGARAKEPVVGFLQQIVGEPIVAGHAGQINPDRPCGLFVEETELVLRHLERSLGVIEGPGAFEIGEHDVAQSAHASCSVLCRVTRPNRDEIRYASAADARKPNPSAAISTPMIQKPSETSSEVRVCTSQNPRPSAPSTTPACIDQRI